MTEIETRSCLLSDEARDKKQCSGIKCLTCGWNPEVRERRNTQREMIGLVTGEDGIQRLVMPNLPEPSEEVMLTLEDNCPICGRVYIKHRIDQKTCSTECGRKLGVITTKLKRQST